MCHCDDGRTGRQTRYRERHPTPVSEPHVVSVGQRLRTHECVCVRRSVSSALVCVRVPVCVCVTDTVPYLVLR